MCNSPIARWLIRLRLASDGHLPSKALSALLRTLAFASEAVAVAVHVIVAPLAFFALGRPYLRRFVDAWVWPTAGAILELTASCP